MFAKITWKVFGLVEDVIECKTEEDFQEIAKAFADNRIWFTVEFPD